ncbi:MAG: DNA mismatch endonuclease Vsr [Phycisphaerae bacterium]|nr:DNA mismatch endonuclease Vsr [Phycisphaerae bacterium]
MAAIRSRDTGPERRVRSIVHALGYRFRLYRRDLPGSPDLVFPRLRAVVFVHGCFWHAHRCRAGRKDPKTNAAFWKAKRTRNRERDRAVTRALRRRGWLVLAVWECELRDAEALMRKLASWLSSASREHPRRPADPQASPRPAARTAPRRSARATRR